MANVSPRQQKAIDHRGSDLLVSASAGSGKTFVLTKRILKYLIENHYSIDQFIILTFTEASAHDMKRKIKSAIESQIDHVDTDTAAHLANQLLVLSQAPIQTFHSYCMALINRYGQVIDLQLPIVISDQSIIRALKNEALDQTLEHFSKDSAFADFIARHSKIFEPKAFFKLIEKFYEKALSYADFNVILARSFGVFEIPFQEHTQFKQLFTRTRSIRKQQILEKIQAMCVEIQADDMEPLDQHLDFFEQLYQAFLPMNVTSLSPVLDFYFEVPARMVYGKSEVNKDLLKKANALKLELMKEIALLLSLDAKEHFESLASLQDDTKYYVDFISHFKIVYQDAKQAQNVYEFNDLERYALEILDNVDVCEYIKSNVVEIMVDEYQDTNEVQETLVNKLASNNVFMVGDLKQSIYGFRNANPNLFIEKQTRYQSSAEGELVVLNQNFRSSESILALANFIMEHLMDMTLAKIEYDDQARLYPGTIPYQNFEHDFIQVPKNDDQQVVEAIAQKVVALVKQGVDRREIAVLTRKKTMHKAIKLCLQKYGVESFVEGTSGYFDSLEIQATLNYLHVINGTKDPRHYYGLMNSVFFDFSEDQLVDIAKTLDHKNINQSIQNSKLVELKDFIEKITYFRQMKDQTISHIVSQVVYQTPFFNRIASIDTSGQRVSNLEFLIDKAQLLEEQSHYSLAFFLNVIERMIADKVDVLQANTIIESDEVIRIMTIHKSKGLEFEHVILYLDKTFNLNDLTENALFSEDYGIVLKKIDMSDGYQKKSTLLFEMLSLQDRMSTYAEEMRILYVALTRPKLGITFVFEQKSELDDSKIAFDTIPLSMRFKNGGIRGWVQHVYTQYCIKDPVDFSLNHRMFEHCDHQVESTNEKDTNFVQPFVQLASIEEVSNVTSVTKMKQAPDKESLEGMKIGTLYHYAMQVIDVEMALKMDMQAFVAYLKHSDIYTHISMLNLDSIYAFFQTDLIANMNMINIHKEMPIIFEYEGQSVQGIIDLLIQDENGYHIIDYKSDTKSEQELVKAYQSQLSLYRQGLSKVHNMPIHIYLYSFHLQKIIVLDSSV